MRVRPFQPTDLAKIHEIYSRQNLPYIFPDLIGPHFESILVVESDTGEFLMAAAAERILQIYLWSADFEPGAKLHAIRMLHEAMAQDLRPKGYNEVNAFLPPSIAKPFARRLMKMFGWTQNWLSLALRF